MYGNHVNPRVEYVSARVRPKKENQKNEKTCVNKHIKIGLEKGMEKVWKNYETSSKKEVQFIKQPLKNQCEKKVLQRA